MFVFVRGSIFALLNGKDDVYDNHNDDHDHDDDNDHYDYVCKLCQ